MFVTLIGIPYVIHTIVTITSEQKDYTYTIIYHTYIYYIYHTYNIHVLYIYYTYLIHILYIHTSDIAAKHYKHITHRSHIAKNIHT